MSRIEIPLSDRESLQVKIYPPNEEIVTCRWCREQRLMRDCWRLAMIIRDRRNGNILRTEELYTCSEACRNHIYSVRSY